MGNQTNKGLAKVMFQFLGIQQPVHGADGCTQFPF
jgi:hypothetical protein